ncbi:cytochrome-c peroxidase [Belnapia sp. F-4-1]|uniref:cytochrome-c peroxidase n=1 Tax=Belnapia sp. F-4-1 TaxID=1545443 RepID=UPI0009DC9840|nr:cytochrome c peroxidase [Belnapia sp. F-4-1]
MRVALRLTSVPLAALLLAAILVSRSLEGEREGPAHSGVTETTEGLHPIGVLHPMVVEERRRALGERLFVDPRLSGDGSRACASCHDLRTNGATANRRDLGLDGQELPLNTATVFNAAFSFRLGWEGGARSLEAHAEALLRSPAIMGTSPDMVLGRLSADPSAVAAFYDAYRRPPDKEALLDALATYQRSLVTPGSPFDRWLAGEAEAITPEERAGYTLFRSVGCAACHQGTNVGGNLFQRHGIFHALAAPEPQILRVPSLRNVAVTAPYFHDGSAATLEEAVRGMGLAQLNLVLDDEQIASIIAFLRTLTGRYRGMPLAAPP